MADIKELNQPSNLTKGAVALLLWGTALTVFTGTTIYWNFGLVQKEMDVVEAAAKVETEARIAADEALEKSFLSKFETLEKSITEKDADVNRRIDTKTARNKGFIDGNENRIDVLERPNSDE